VGDEEIKDLIDDLTQMCVLAISATKGDPLNSPCHETTDRIIALLRQPKVAGWSTGEEGFESLVHAMLAVFNIHAGPLNLHAMEYVIRGSGYVKEKAEAEEFEEDEVLIKHVDVVAIINEIDDGLPAPAYLLEDDGLPAPAYLLEKVAERVYDELVKPQLPAPTHADLEAKVSELTAEQIPAALEALEGVKKGGAK
jgi:hypothetical protein